MGYAQAMARLLLILSLSLVLGCGARSVLDAGAGATSGQGGSGAMTGSGGAGGAPTGTGGSSLACASLEAGLGPTFLSWPDPFFHTARPDLVGLEDDGVAWVTSLVPVESPGPVPYDIGHAELRPWTGGALIGSEPRMVSMVGGRAVVATETGRVGLYALALDTDEVIGPGMGMRVVRTVDPENDYTPVPNGVDVPAGPASPELLVEMDDGLLYGWQISPTGGAAYLGLARIGEEVELATSPESGCADPAIEVRAVPTSGGAIVAAASGREPNSCFDDGIPGPPRFLQTGFIDGETLLFDVTQSELFEEPIHFLDLVGGGDHAWAIWQTDGSLSEVPPPVRAARLDPNGVATAPSVEVLPSGYFPPYGITAMGDGFAIAYLDVFDAGPPLLMVAVFDENGQRLGEGSLPLDFFGFGQRLAAIASPDHDAVLVGFAASDGSPEADPTGFVRFDCVP